MAADVHCGSVSGNHVCLCYRVSEISCISGYGRGIFLAVRAGASGVCVPDPNVRTGNLYGLDDPDQLMGMRYLCICSGKADRQEEDFPGFESQEVAGGLYRRCGGRCAAGRAVRAFFRGKSVSGSACCRDHRTDLCCGGGNEHGGRPGGFRSQAEYGD